MKQGGVGGRRLLRAINDNGVLERRKIINHLVRSGPVAALLWARRSKKKHTHTRDFFCLSWETFCSHTKEP